MYYALSSLLICHIFRFLVMLLSELENCEYICVYMIYWFPIMKGEDKVGEKRKRKLK
jgi:hypothetical protein